MGQPAEIKAESIDGSSGSNELWKSKIVENKSSSRQGVQSDITTSDEGNETKPKKGTGGVESANSTSTESRPNPLDCSSSSMFSIPDKEPVKTDVNVSTFDAISTETGSTNSSSDASGSPAVGTTDSDNATNEAGSAKAKEKLETSLPPNNCAELICSEMSGRSTTGTKSATVPKTPKTPKAPKTPARSKRSGTPRKRRMSSNSLSSLPFDASLADARLSSLFAGKNAVAEPKTSDPPSPGDMSAMTFATDIFPKQATSVVISNSIGYTDGGRSQPPLSGILSSDSTSMAMVSTNDWDNDYVNMETTMASQSSKSVEEDDETLTWRLDPEVSLSDWTINITNKDDKSVHKFHVHKNMLAVGGRKSEYFATVFKNAAKNPGTPSSTTDISMGTAAIKGVPALLDFLYSGDKPLQITTDNAIGLRYLSRKFGVKKAFDPTMEFIQKDFSMEKIAHYYRDSLNMHDEKMIASAVNLCGHNLTRIGPSSALLSIIEPGFLAKIIAIPGVANDERNLHVSLLVASYCKMHKEKLQADTFQMLTSADMLPVIHRAAVLPLLDMEADIVIHASVESFTFLSSLQQRCLRDITGYWHELSETDPQETTRVCRKLPSIFVAELLGRSIVTNKAANPSTNAPPRSQQGRGLNEITEQLRRNHQREIMQLRQAYENKILALGELYAEKEREIEACRQELLCFERLPNSHDGKLVCSGIMKGHPTQMPVLVEYDKDGYILTCKKEAQKYAVFYYKRDE